jgi:hypothetical protein
VAALLAAAAVFAAVQTHGELKVELAGPRHAVKRFHNFHEFFPFYLTEHSDPLTKVLHGVGTSIAVLFALSQPTLIFNTLTAVASASWRARRSPDSARVWLKVPSWSVSTSCAQQDSSLASSTSRSGARLRHRVVRSLCRRAQPPRHLHLSLVLVCLGFQHALTASPLDASNCNSNKYLFVVPGSRFFSVKILCVFVQFQ